MFFVIVGTLMILTNLAGIGPFADWNWNISGDLWKFCVPFGLAAIWWAWADSSGYNKRKEVEKMDAKKTARRAQNMEALGMDARGRPKGRKR
jgi:small Trp-rich protein